MNFIKNYVLATFIFNVCLLEATCNLGSFTQVLGSPFETVSNSLALAFSPITTSKKLFAATVNNFFNSIAVYQVNQVTGEFTQITGSPFSTGAGANSIAFSPITTSGNLYAAVTNNSPNTVSVYLVDQSTGIFTQVTGSPFATGSDPDQVTFSPLASGNLFAALVNIADGTISIYLVDQMNGTFNPVGSPVSAGTFPIAIAFSPITTSGELFLAVTNLFSSSGSVYSVNTSNGVLTQVHTFTTGSEPDGVVFSPLVSGNLFAMVSNNSSSANSVSVYSVNQSTGAFTQVSGSPFAAGLLPNGPAFSPLASGNLFAAVANDGDNTASVYSVDQNTGKFTQITGSPYGTGTSPFSVVFSPITTAGYLFAGAINAGAGTISVYNVTIPPTVTLSSSTSVTTPGGLVILTAVLLGVAPFTLTWSDGFIQTNVTSMATHTVRPSTTTNYSVIAVDANGCTSDPSIPVTIDVNSVGESTLSIAIGLKYCTQNAF